MRPKDIVILLAPIGIVVLCLIVAPLLLLPNGIQIGTGSPAVPAPAPGGASPAASPGAQGAGGGDAQNGTKLFLTKGCAACHTISDISGAAGKVGPELTHIGTEAATMKPGMSAEAYIRESEQQPAAFTVPNYPAGVMPPFAGTDQELNDIVTMLLAHK